MTAWQRTTNRTPARYTRTALQHARVQFPRLSIAGGLLSVAFATVLVVMAAAFTTPVVALGALGLLAVAAGVTFMTQPADSGFWMIKEYGNLSVRDVMLRLNACRIFMSLCGVTILIVCEAVFW